MESLQETDTELLLTEPLKNFEAETSACKDLIVRRARVCANFVKAKRDLERAKQTGKNVPATTQAVQVTTVTREL